MTFKTWGVRRVRISERRKPGWWFCSYFFIFTPKLGEDEPRLTCAYFSKGLVQPPTSCQGFAMNVPFWAALVGLNITPEGLKMMSRCKTLFFFQKTFGVKTLRIRSLERWVGKCIA